MLNRVGHCRSLGLHGNLGPRAFGGIPVKAVKDWLTLCCYAMLSCEQLRLPPACISVMRPTRSARGNWHATGWWLVGCGTKHPTGKGSPVNNQKAPKGRGHASMASQLF